MAKRKPNRPGRKGVPSRQKARRPKAASGPPKRSSPRSKRAPRAAGGRPGKLVYDFEEGNKEMKYLLGGKGANLAEMSNLGLPVPPGFTITTGVCTHYYANGRAYPDALAGEVDAALGAISRLTGRAFGDAANPLLVSVRSGARASMPGMMDTVLNLGLNDATVAALAASADRRFAYDSYRRFIQMYANVVLDLDHHVFEERLEDYKHEHGYVLDTDLD